jgi:hypothetical protein
MLVQVSLFQVQIVPQEKQQIRQVLETPQQKLQKALVKTQMGRISQLKTL